MDVPDLFIHSLAEEHVGCCQLIFVLFCLVVVAFLLQLGIKLLDACKHRFVCV